MSPPQGSVVVVSLDDLRAVVAEEVGRGVAHMAATFAPPKSADPPVDAAELLKVPDVCALLKVGPRELRRLVREGKFPAPITLGARRIRWPRSVVVAAATKGTK